MNRALVPALLLSALFATPSLAALNEGDKAPDFSAQASLAGKAFNYTFKDALKKGPVVVYFYPKSFTPGCTIEAHEFADNAENFAGVEVKRYTVDSLYLARVRAERRVQILHAQKILFTHGAHLFSFGSNASRRPSPNRFRLSTIRQIIRAGKISLYG